MHYETLTSLQPDAKRLAGSFWSFRSDLCVLHLTVVNLATMGSFKTIVLLILFISFMVFVAFFGRLPALRSVLQGPRISCD